MLIFFICFFPILSTINSMEIQEDNDSASSSLGKKKSRKELYNFFSPQSSIPSSPSRFTSSYVPVEYSKMQKAGAFGLRIKVKEKQAEWTNQKTFTMKLIPVDMPKAENEKKVLIKLASLAAHPNLPQVEYVSQTSKIYKRNLTKYYEAVIELLDGELMSDFLKRKKVLTENLVRSILLQVANALEDLHKNNIVYGYMLPENIMLSNSGNDSKGPTIVKLIDFGFSNYFENIANELVFFNDWYEFGKLMYIILFGEEPFKYGSQLKNSDITDIEKYYKKELIFPPEPKISQEAKELMKTLLLQSKDDFLARKINKTYIEKMKRFLKEKTLFQRFISGISLESKTNKESKKSKEVGGSSNETKSLTPDDFEDVAGTELIGEGSFGRVWKVQAKSKVKNKSIEKFYAMKITYATANTSSNEMKVFKKILELNKLSEGSTNSGIKKCPYLAEPVAADQEGETYRLPYTKQQVYRSVMEYVNGYELANLLTNSNTEKKNTLPEDLARLFLYQIAEGINWLHTHEMIYGDLKPSNVMIEKREYKSSEKPFIENLITGNIKIIDFGLTTCGTTCNLDQGSLEYQSPEIYRNQEYSFYVDWWAFGVLIYRMLFGKEPFSIRDQIMKEDSIRRGKKKINYNLVFPENSDHLNDAKNLIERLLNVDLNKRLGKQKSDYEDILKTKWFQKDIEMWNIFKANPHSDDAVSFVGKISKEFVERCMVQLSKSESTHNETKSYDYSYRMLFRASPNLSFDSFKSNTTNKTQSSSIREETKKLLKSGESLLSLSFLRNYKKNVDTEESIISISDAQNLPKKGSKSSIIHKNLSKAKSKIRNWIDKTSGSSTPVRSSTSSFIAHQKEPLDAETSETKLHSPKTPKRFF